MAAPYYVYVLANPQGSTYVGQADDLDRRLGQHNDPSFVGTLHTKRRPGPWRIIYREEVTTRAEAMRRERELKAGGGRRFIRSLLGGTCPEGGC